MVDRFRAVVPKDVGWQNPFIKLVPPLTNPIPTSEGLTEKSKAGESPFSAPVTPAPPLEETSDVSAVVAKAQRLGNPSRGAIGRNKQRKVQPALL